jgi:hypothetical protein
MRRRLTWIAIIGLGIPVSAALLFVCAFLATWVWGCDLTPATELTRVEAGNNRSIVFYGDTCWEVSRNVSYEVQENGQTIIPRASLGNHYAMNFTFKAVSAEDESLVAVYTPFVLDYDAIFVMIDFGARETWHSGEYSEGKAKGLELFQRLKQANPNLSEPKELLR